MSKTIGIIPARYGSSRFPGKPLVDIKGKSMIQRVFEQVNKASKIDHALVATDDTRILEHVKDFGGNVIMTREDHVSGTERCLEAYEHQGQSFDRVINIQGDEPFIDPDQIDEVANLLDKDRADISTLAVRITDEEELFNPNAVKVVLNDHKQAMLFSRSAIPYQRNFDKTEWVGNYVYLKHLGIYGFHTEILKKICKLPHHPLEKSESLEQLRWLANAFEIQVSITEKQGIGIDTPEDLQKVLRD